MKTLRRFLWPALMAALLAVGLGYALTPRPTPVDMVQAATGELVITIDDDGVTRVKDVYVISAPISGRVLRFDRHVGDAVAANETVLASILPTDPAFRDIRTQAQLESEVKAAEAARNLAAAEVERQQAQLDYARAEFARSERLFEKGHVSAAALDRARRDLRAADAALATARAALAQREHELLTAQAASMVPTIERHEAAPASGCCFPVRSPVDGRVLKMYQESEAVVAVGAPLAEVGDPADLEIAVDLLSRDAVRVSPGDAVIIENWGGDGTLNGRVRLIEPFGVTKVSSLGIEEQRVNAIVDLTDPRERWRRLGHGYHIDARIVLLRQQDVLLVPLTALFRSGGEWALFRAVEGRARLTAVRVGQMSDRHARILDGLAPGDWVVLHPSDAIADGVRIEALPATAERP